MPTEHQRYHEGKIWKCRACAFHMEQPQIEVCPTCKHEKHICPNCKRENSLFNIQELRRMSDHSGALTSSGRRKQASRKSIKQKASVKSVKGMMDELGIDPSVLQKK